MKYSFVKMHGLGNDYIFIDGRIHPVPEPQQVASSWCNRHTGIGGDGIVLILPSSRATVKMRIFNLDGSEAQTCGNALRCIGKYLHDNNELKDTKYTVETRGGIVSGEITGKTTEFSTVAMDMGKPSWDPVNIPVTGFSSSPLLNIPLTIAGNTQLQVSCVSLGNPHCVIEVDNLEKYPVVEHGPKVESSPMFPEKTNVEFMQLVDDNTIKLRVWERGSGETLACGSGACAAYAVWSRIYNLTNPMNITLPGGTLRLSFSHPGGTIIQEGNAMLVFEGSITV